MLRNVPPWLSLVLALPLLALACFGPNAQTANENYERARERFHLVASDPARFPASELERAANDLAAAMVAMGDAVRDDTRAAFGQVAALGAGGGVGGIALAQLAAHLLARFKKPKGPTDAPSKRQPRKRPEPEPEPDPAA